MDKVAEIAVETGWQDSVVEAFLDGGSFALVERRERPRRVRTLEEAEAQEVVRVTRGFFPQVWGPVPTSILTQVLRGFAEGTWRIWCGMFLQGSKP